MGTAGKMTIIAFWLATSLAAASAEGLEAAQVEAFKQARAAGQLQEGADGYLKPTSQEAALHRLAEQVNAQRRLRYQQLAKQEGVPLSVVEQTAGHKLRGK